MQGDNKGDDAESGSALETEERLADVWKRGREEDAPSAETRKTIRGLIHKARQRGDTSLLIESTTRYHWKYLNPWWPRPDDRRLFALTRWLKKEGLEVTYHTRTNNRETILDIYVNLPA